MTLEVVEVLHRELFLFLPIQNAVGVPRNVTRVEEIDEQ